MKIFDWVHQHFHHNSVPSCISTHEDKFAAVSIKSESKYLKDNGKYAAIEPSNRIVDMTDNWKFDDILTIGTLAIDPIPAFNQQNELGINKDEDDEEELVSEYFTSNGGEDSTLTPPEGIEVLDLISAFDDNSETLKFYQEEYLISDELQCNEIELVVGVTDLDAKEELIKKDRYNRKRVTLAELFKAEHDDLKKYKSNPKDMTPFSHKKPTFRAKKGSSKAKRFLGHVKEDLHSLKKFQKFVTRIIKKKVHPELDSKVYEEYNTGIKPGAGNHKMQPTLDQSICSIFMLPLQFKV